MIRIVRFLGVVALLLAALVSGLVFAAARSDFAFRGCQSIPRAEWSATANCADGWFAQVVFGGLALVLAASTVLVWRWRAAA